MGEDDQPDGELGSGISEGNNPEEFPESQQDSFEGSFGSKADGLSLILRDDATMFCTSCERDVGGTEPCHRQLVASIETPPSTLRANGENQVEVEQLVLRASDGGSGAKACNAAIWCTLL